MIWGLNFLLIARLTKLSPSYKLLAVSGFILVGAVWDAGSKGADVGIKKHQTQWDQFPHTVSIPRPCILEGQWWYRMTVCPKRGGNARRFANSLLLWLSFLTASFLGTWKSLQNCLCQLYLYGTTYSDVTVTVCEARPTIQPQLLVFLVLSSC